MSVQAEAITIDGHCDERFADVASELRANFAERGELGASVAVTVAGEPVVDLWGGWADPERRTPWGEDTVAVMMSCTKGATALCAHMLAVAGELDFDERVATYWPRFAANGKQDVLVRHVLSHQAGVPALRTPLAPGGFFDWDAVIAALEEERPWWEPGTGYGYHGFTYGFLVGELVRRVTGTPIRDFLRTEVAEPLGLDLAMGLPAADHGRVARVQPPPPPAPGEPVAPWLVAAMSDPASMQALMIGNTGGYFVPGEWDSPAALEAVIPAAGGVGNARSLATLYRAIVHDRRVGRVAFAPEDVARMGAVCSALGQDRMLLAPGRWALGFMKGAVSPRGVEPPARVVLSETAFGHIGHGGSIGFCDPACDLSFGYVMNQMDPDQGLSDKAQSMIDATYRALGYASARDGAWVSA
jgi:CubicO group peptidase (beta-lactamase class C family)